MGTFTERVMYRTDRGQVLAVEDMQVSHLLNAINHHNKQIQTLEWIEDTYGGPMDKIKQRRKDLSNTVDILVGELQERGVEDDPERHPEGGRPGRSTYEDNWLHNDRDW